MHRKVPEGGDRVVTLACMEDDAIGQRLTVFLGSEVDFEPLAESSWEAVTQRGFDQPRQFSAYLNTLRWNGVTTTDTELSQGPYRAGIDVKAYQLEPLRIPRGSLPPDTPELELSRLLQRYRKQREARRFSADSELADLSDGEVLVLEDAQTRSALRQAAPG